MVITADQIKVDPQDYQAIVELQSAATKFNLRAYTHFMAISGGTIQAALQPGELEVLNELRHTRTIIEGNLEMEKSEQKARSALTDLKIVDRFAAVFTRAVKDLGFAVPQDLKTQANIALMNKYGIQVLPTLAQG